MRSAIIEIPFFKKQSKLFYFQKGETSLVIQPRLFLPNIYDISLYTTNHTLKTIKYFNVLTNDASEPIDIRGYDAFRLQRNSRGLKFTAEIFLRQNEEDLGQFDGGVN